jgi:hypothetical protein
MTVTQTQLRSAFFRESTCEHLSQGCAVTQGPGHSPRFALSILYLTYITVYLKKDFILYTCHH